MLVEFVQRWVRPEGREVIPASEDGYHAAEFRPHRFLRPFSHGMTNTQCVRRQSRGHGGGEQAEGDSGYGRLVSAESTDRVCPVCGSVPGTGIHCITCGTNLMWRRRLQTRGDWQRRRKIPLGPEAPARLRYTARDLERLRVDSGRFKRGRLVLMLALQEVLEDEEVVQVLASAKEGDSRTFVAITSQRMLLIDDSDVSFTKGRADALPLRGISRVKARRGLYRSRLRFRAGGKKRTLKVRGRDTTAKLLEWLPERTRR